MGVELGVALAAVGREGQAVTYLQRSVVAGGEFDHPLTSVALFELGRLAMIRGDFPPPGKYFAGGLLLRRCLALSRPRHPGGSHFATARWRT